MVIDRFGQQYIAEIWVHNWVITGNSVDGIVVDVRVGL
jgi:hypothetical protein